jgi:hypothetical protein
MFVGIQLNIKVSVNLERRGGYAIFFLQSNIAIDKITWKVHEFLPTLTYTRNDGKEIDLYFKWSQIGPLNLSMYLVQSEYLGNDLGEYLKTAKSEFSSTVSESTSAAVEATTALGLAGGLGLLAIIASKMMSTK